MKIRPLGAAEASLLDGIERAADGLFDPLFALPDGSPRSSHLGEPGFVLVAERNGALVGFVHVLEFDARFHLEQLSVHPDAQGGGVGSALLVAAEATVVARGASVVTLRTFADVPWNAPFYARRGYVEVPLPRAMQGLEQVERDLGLTSLGRRVTMAKQVAADVTPWPAVSVLPVRGGARGIEVFVQFRAATMDFAAGAVVFPGGRVDADESPLPVPAAHAEAWRDTDLPPAGLLAAAAVREVHEECGVVLRAADLVPWDDWVTPPGGRRRFDVAFFLTAARADQRWRNTTSEAVAAGWRRPSALLDSADAGELRLLPPTRTLLAELDAIGTVAEALRRRPRIVPVHNDQAVRRDRGDAGPGQSE